jgi:two-component system sensor histidine kinase UhpB
MRSRPHSRRPRELPLFWRIFIPNALVLIAAGAVLVLSPAEVDTSPNAGQAIALGAGLLVMMAINLVLIRRALDPLRRLSESMTAIDPPEPGRRIEAGGGAETRQLGEVFNAMLGRFESERRDSGRRLIAAQEEERLRVARELHDEIGQVAASLTLEIDHAAAVAGPEVRERLGDAREAARALSAKLSAIVKRLRPETLEDLGLASALTVLADRLAEQQEIRITRRLDATHDLPDDVELAVYRVAQESTTNIVRHAGASAAWIELTVDGGSVVLTVADDGRGMRGAAPGDGIRGMRERALLLDGTLRIGDSSRGGVEVRLRLPAGSPR